METSTTIPVELAARVDTYDDPVDLVGLFALREFLAGTQPMARTCRLQRVRPQASLVPPGLVPVRRAATDSVRALMAEGPGWTLVAKAWTDRTATVTVTAVSEELAADVLGAATADAEEPEADAPGVVDVSFWHIGSHGPRRVERRLDVPAWEAIDANYSARPRRSVAELVALDQPPTTGRLVLLHGPPGTGKTTIIRALAWAWRDWCRLDHVLDPEDLLRSPAYLLRVLADDEDDDRWRLLVLEDCDELIRADAKADTGQSLARLLNVTDGLVGEAGRALVCITTNERLGRLHPAVVRPGRCLAEVEVGPLEGGEARRWLGSPLPGGRSSATLAELFAWRSGIVVDAEPEPAAGTYL